MLAAGRRHTDRLWAVEGCSGIGRHVAQRLVADGETVVDVPAKLDGPPIRFALPTAMALVKGTDTVCDIPARSDIDLRSAEHRHSRPAARSLSSMSRKVIIWVRRVP
jgi:NAD(P)-dependent dehydrogenase (short-subunit alcohol dehydrogenase family)